MTIKEFLAEFEYRVNTIEDENTISLWIEFTLLDYLDNFTAERADIAERLNEELLDICSMTSPGPRWPEFRKLASKELEHLKHMYFRP